MEKHHYAAVFKSNHLGIADLEEFIEGGIIPCFMIREVKQEFGTTVAGKKGDFNIAYFVEPIKPLVLNATNSKQIKKFSGGSPFVEDWKMIAVELFIDNNVKMKGETVGGVRIKPIQPNVNIDISHILKSKDVSFVRSEANKVLKSLNNAQKEDVRNHIAQLENV